MIKSIINTLLFMIAFLKLLSSISFAQDVHFSQFRETPLLINPAQTALNKDLRIILNYKNQWKSVTSPYRTFAFSGEYTINHKNKSPHYLAAGLQLFNDKAGDSQMKTTIAMLSLNGIIKVAKDQKVCVGIMAGVGQRSINYSELKWGSQYDGTNYNSSISTNEPVGVNSFVYPDIGAGVLWNLGKDQKYINTANGIKSTVGFSFFHFGLPKYSYYKKTSERLNTKFVGHANVEINVPDYNMIVIPELLFTRQGPLMECNTGVLVKYILQEGSKYSEIKKMSAFSFGIHYRVKDAIIPTVLYEYSNYAIGITYDVNVSKLRAASNLKGGFEIALRYVTPNQFRKSKARF